MKLFLKLMSFNNSAQHMCFIFIYWLDIPLLPMSLNPINLFLREFVLLLEKLFGEIGPVEGEGRKGLQLMEFGSVRKEGLQLAFRRH